MAATSLLARLGLRSALIGSAASLVYAAPIADGNVSNDAHTHAGRTGWYHPTPTSMGFVANATEVLRLAQTEVTAYAKLVTAAATVAGPGFVLTPGVAPAAPANGDVWLTSVDAYARINGVTRTLGEETYVASVATEATLQAAVAAAEASSYKDAVITITASITLTGGIGSTLTKNYTFIGTGSTGAGGGIRPTLTKGNGPWMNANGKNLSFVNLQVNANLPQNFIDVGPNVNVHCFGCSFTYTGGGNFFYRQYAGALTASFDNCTVTVSSGSFLWFGESNPADTNIPQGEVLFTGCTLSGLMVKCDNAGKVNCSLVGCTLTNPGTGCWYATEFSAGRSNLVVNYSSRDTISLALAAGSTDTITFNDRASAGGSATLTSTYVGVGDGSNLLSGSAALTFSGSSLKVSPAVAGDGTVVVEAGTGTPTTARAILFLRGNVASSTTGWFFIRQGTTIGSHLDLMYTPSANINDVANVTPIRFFTDGGVQIGGAYSTSPGAGCLALNTSFGNVTRLDVKGRAQFVSDTNTTEIAFFGHPGFQGVRWAGTSEGVLLESSNNVATAANAGATFTNFFCNATTSQMAMDIGRGLDRTSRLSRTAGGWAVNALTAVGRDAGYTTTTQTLFRVANRNPTASLLLTGGARYFEVTEYDTSVASEMPIFYIDALRDVYVTSRLLLANGAAANPALTFTADPNTGIFLQAPDIIGFAANGAEQMRMSAFDLVCSIPVKVPDGSAASPGYTFTSDGDTGIYLAAANTLSVTTGGTLRLSIDTSSILPTLPIRTIDGTAAAPAYSFAGGSNAGMYATAANVLSFSTTSAERMRVYADGGVAIGGSYSGSFGAGSLRVNGLTVAAAQLFAYGTGYAVETTTTWSGGASAAEGSGVRLISSIQALTGNQTATVGIASVRTRIDTNSALTSAVTVTGMAGWYEKSDLTYALGGGGSLAITNYYGGYVANMPAPAAGVTITNQYGLYLEAPTRGSTLNIALYAAGLVHLAAAENHAITRVSGNTTLDATHFSVEVDASGGPVTITLPDSTGTGVNGRIYNIKKIDNSANAVTIARSGADTIDGATSQSLTAQWQSRTVQARAATPGYAIF